MGESNTCRRLLPRMLKESRRVMANPDERRRMALDFADVALAFARKIEDRNPTFAEALCLSGVEILERGGVMHRNHLL